MAELGNYQDKLIQDEPGMGTGGEGSSSTAQPSAGTSGVISGGTQQGASTAGVGAGGSGGWTNIQAYLGANKADSGSSALLENKAAGQFDSENQNLQTQAGNAKTQAEGEAKKINDAKDHSKEWVNQAANAYSWTGNQNQDYKDGVNKIQGAMTGQYAGPEKFAYQKTADFQKTGSALGDNSAFSNYMNDIYKDKAGGQLTSGQGALQTQLDVNNEALANSRKNLLSQYSGFDDNVNKAVTDTDSAIQKSKQDYGNNQAALKDYLGNYGNEVDTQIGKLENDARSAYNREYTSGKSGLATAKNDSGYMDWLQANTGNPSIVMQAGLNGGYWGTDLTWDQLQKEKNAGPGQSGLGSFGNGTLQALVDREGRNRSALSNFYNQEDQKYANTADPEEKQWNTIMDVLGRSDRKQQGFKVRG